MGGTTPDKEDLERALENADKGCVVTIINQTSHLLAYDSNKKVHGKFKVKPPRLVSPKV